MGINWTEDQKRVIDERDKDILVSAAAGSGKTAVLVERIISRIVNEHIDIDRILVVTFTKAAAAQMKEKIFGRLKELSAGSTDEHIKRQTTLINNASISTIDSFCNALVKERFHEIGIDPGFRVCDEDEKDILFYESMEEVLEESYNEGKPEFLALAKSYTKRDKDDTLYDLIKDLYLEIQAHPWPMEVLDSFLEPYEEDYDDFFSVEWICELTEYLRNCLIGIRDDLVELIDWLSDMTPPDERHPYMDTFDSDLAIIDSVLDANDDEAFHFALATFHVDKISTKKCKFDDSDIKKKAKDKRDAIKKAVLSLKELAIEDKKYLIGLIKSIYPNAKALVELVKKLDERFMKKKSEMGLADFSDIEHFALNVLVDRDTKLPTQTAIELRSYYDEIMVDEYQDSNYLQEAILISIAKREPGSHNYFCVGDVKQSIYAFRKAKPEIFMEKFNRFILEDSDNTRIDLGQNFRSRKEVVEAVNDVFDKVMKSDLGGVEYDEKSRLAFGAEFLPKLPENTKDSFSTVVSFANRDEDIFSESNLSIDAVDALIVAKEIEDMVGKQLVTDEDSGMLRPARYSDIVILHRSAVSVAGTYQDILRQRDIPVEVINQTGYFTSREVEGVLGMLSVLDNPFSDVLLVSALKNIFCVSDDTLLEIKTGSDKESFFEALRDYKNANGSDENIGRFFAFYDANKALVSEESIHDIILKIMNDTGFANRMMAMPKGSLRLANLEKLLTLAVSFEDTGFKGIFSFVEYIGRMKKYEKDLGVTEESKENSVRFMTFHKSKGLEFPIVIVAGMGKEFKGNSGKKIIIHPTYGMGMDMIDYKRRTLTKTLFKKAISAFLKKDEMGENLRLLYVALTRAKDRMIITGSLSSNDLDRMVGKKHRFGFYERLNAKCFFDWIIPSLLLHKDKYDIKPRQAFELIDADAAREIKSFVKESDIELLAEDEYDITPLCEKFSYSYTYKALSDKKNKYSVSEVKQMAMHAIMEDEVELMPFLDEDDSEKRLPKCMGGKEEVANNNAVRGTAMHKLMEYFDFDNDYTKESYENLIKDMEEKGLLDPQLIEVVRKDEKLCKKWVDAFAKSKLCERMRKAFKDNKLYREKTFVMGKQPSELFDENCKEEDNDIILIQGIVDAFFMEDDKCVLLDYKTDYIKNENELIDRYKKQIQLYRDAIEKAYGIIVKDCYLYSFVLGKEICVI